MNTQLEIVEMFISVNGEGDELGRRTVFVRTFGCSAGCPKCDTPYAKGKRTNEVKSIYPQEIIDFCQKYKMKHVTLTGGEPFEQANVREIIKFLIQHGVGVTIETNGIEKPGALDPRVHVVVSPKPWMLTDENRDSYFYWARWGATFKFAGGPADVERIRKWYKIFRLNKAYIMPWIDPAKTTVQNMRNEYLKLMEAVNEKFNDGEDVRIVPQFHKYIWLNKRGV